MPRDISSLPPEVLTHIFQLLNGGDRLKASQVCKKWLQIIDCHQLLCEVRIVFSGKAEEAVKLFSHMTRQFQWFSFRRVVISDSVVEFLNKYRQQFVTLSFINCEVGYSKCASEFQGKIPRCDKLKTLNIKNSEIASLFASLPNVTAFKLHMTFGLSDHVISEFNKSLSKLEKLSLISTVPCEEDVFETFYINEETMKSKPSNSVLSFTSIKQLIGKNRTTLKHINFLSLRLSEKAVVTLSKMEGLKLKSISFPYVFYSSYIKEFCENQNSLTSLDLSFLLYDTDNTVCAICKCLPNLQELIIRYKQAIDRCILEVFQLRNLVKLVISSCFNISRLSYREAVSNHKTYKLEYLDLSCAEISDDCLFKLLEHNQNIRYLNVTYTRVSNKTLNMICKKLTLLECLILESCPAISDSGLTGEFENYSDSITPTPLTNLKYLIELNFNFNSLITNHGCIKSFRFPKLERLCMERCRGLSIDNDFEMELKKQNPCLRILKVSQ
ncbi:f-box domain-containing protein [Trichonephila clavata]|uniref:F-box domain-containing protein n=1 Tax=Trichonephila clavata TaxID=2740835 RepID=A0A8X6HDY7_TRICU|nr:f-box domain-containing protein [Trichonephila clavata]